MERPPCFEWSFSFVFIVLESKKDPVDVESFSYAYELFKIKYLLLYHSALGYLLHPVRNQDFLLPVQLHLPEQ